MVASEQTQPIETSPRAGLKTAYIVCGVVGVGLSFCVAAIQIQPDLLYLAGAGGGLFGLLVVLLASFIMGLKQWRVAFFSWMGPVALSVGFLIMVPAYQWIGRSFADWRLKAHLQKYGSIVDGIRSGKISVSQSLSDIDIKALPPEVINIRAVRKIDGSVLVIFLTGGGFPLHHTGYVFNGSGTNVDCMAEFNAFSNKVSLRKEGDGWYYFGD